MTNIIFKETERDILGYSIYCDVKMLFIIFCKKLIFDSTDTSIHEFPLKSIKSKPTKFPHFKD